MSAPALWLYLSFPQLQLDCLQAIDTTTPPTATRHTESNLTDPIDGHLPPTQLRESPIRRANLENRPDKNSSEPSNPGKKLTCKPQNAVTTTAVVLIDERYCRVIQRNTVAAERGIQVGMPLAQACALADHLQVLPYDLPQQRQQLQQLANLLYQSCADIALDDAHGLWLRLDPMLKLYHGLPALLHTLWQLLAQRALHFQWAIAPTAPGARVCCLYQSGLSFTTFTAYRQQLESIPLSLLQLPSDLTTALQRLGLRTIGQWLALPGASLSRRFPKQLAELKAMLLGERLWPLNYLLPVVHFSEQLELLWQVEQQQYLHKPLQLLLKRLQQFLLTTDQLCYQTQLVLHIRDLPAMRLTLQSPQALSQAEHWLRLWQQKLSQLPLTGPVCMLTLSAENYCPQQAITADLYSKVQGDCPPLQLLGLLQARLGESQVRQPAFHPQWQHCYHAQDSSPATTTSSATAFASSTESLPASLQSPHTPPRPAFIFATPQPLPTPVEFLPGLERVHAQWWQSSQPLQLDLRHAQSSDGRYLWLCRQPGKDWHWLGVFA